MALFQKRKTNYFFDQFALVGSYSLKAMEKLKEGLEDFSHVDVNKWKNDVHQIEHAADGIKHETEERLAKEFMTPIDREDIFMLLDNIDDLTDSIDEISYKLYLRDYTALPEATMAFVDVAYRGVKAVEEVLKNLSSLTNKKLLDPLIQEVRDIEEEADHLYEEHVHALYKKVTNDNYLDIRLAEKVYGLFEYVTDQCRNVTKTVEIIMYKNL